MIIRLINSMRCTIASRILSARHPWRYGLARRISPDTTSLIRHRPRKPPALQLPLRSHLIYHQSSVDSQAALNSIQTLASQIPQDDEVLFLDIGATGDPEWLSPFSSHEWFSWSACRALHIEQQSYTFGLNAAMGSLKAKSLFVWRTDYVYPPDMVSRYQRALETALFAAPYGVLIGQPHVDSGFVRSHTDRLSPFDESFWRACASPLSLYETQDPALFAIDRELWRNIGGLNHSLWGYGWQFAEFAARVRTAAPASKINYFSGLPPVHQTHRGSNMHQPADRAREAEMGRRRFCDFLGGEHAYEAYRLKQVLPPQKKGENGPT